MWPLDSKYQSLRRYAALLPGELDAWVDYVKSEPALEKNYTQIQVVERFMRALCEENRAHLDGLDREQTAPFLDGALAFGDEIIRIQTIWAFFRDRIETRFIPIYQQPLLVVDLVSYDCYTTVLDRAHALRLRGDKRFREYPLSGLQAAYSPATWRRHARPPALQNNRLPLPVIDLPWAHVLNPWELLTIAHEVGHDIDQDLGPLTPHLQAAIRANLAREGVPPERIAQWEVWTGELLADVVGVLLTGPAFVRVLLELITLPMSYMRRIAETDVHPPHYLRGLVNTALLRQLGLEDDADAIDAQWTALHGAEVHAVFAPYLPEVDPVLAAILDTPLEPLTDAAGVSHRLREFVTFTPEQQALIKDCAARLIADEPIRKRVAIRHLVSAAKEAALCLIETGHEHELPVLAERTQKAIIAIAPPGKLGGTASLRDKERLSAMARLALDTPLGDFGLSEWEGVMR